MSVIDRAKKVTYKALSSKDKELSAMCKGPDGSLLVWDETNKVILELGWNDGDKQLYQMRKMKVSINGVKGICFNQLYNVTILISSHCVTAVYHDTNIIAWKLNDKTWSWSLNGSCCDAQGNIYVANSMKRKPTIMVLCGANGHILLEEEISKETNNKWIEDVCWLMPTNKLVMSTGIRFVSYDISIKPC